MSKHLRVALLTAVIAGFPLVASAQASFGDSSDRPESAVDSAPATFSASSSFQRQVLLDPKSSGNTVTHALDLPKGAMLISGPDEVGSRELRSDLMVVDAKGNLLGIIDAAWAQDESGTVVPSHYVIRGGALVQVLDTSAAVGAVTLLLQYTGVDSEAAATAIPGAKAYVGIPSNYSYNLNHPRKTLHDYCTKSPDEFPNPVGGNANFRGPCARHDMCFEQRQASQYTCNNRLWSDLVSNCKDKYSWYNPTRQACINTANVYWAAVTANTIYP